MTSRPAGQVRMTETYDGIVIGAGHNGLILAAYAARAGLSVLCIDSAREVGGGLTTIEYPQSSAFLHNTHSYFHRGLTAMPWYRHLELESLGAEYLHPEINVALVTRDERCLLWCTDFESTFASVSALDQRDADELRLWRDRFRPIVQQILIPEAQSPPLPPDERRLRLERSEAGRILLEISRYSPLEFVQRHFRHPLVRAGLLFFNGLREVDLRLPGFGHHIPALLASDHLAQICRGGSRQLAVALVRAVRRAGGEVITQAPPRRVLVENGRAGGVVIADGTCYRARRFVASSLNPQQTFLELLEPHCVPADWRRAAEAFEYNLLAPLFSLHVNLREPPLYSAARHCTELQRACMVILGLEDDRQFSEMVQHHELGRVPPPLMWGSCPTLFDPSQAPQESHTAFMWEKVPYALHGDPAHWEKHRDLHADRMLHQWGRFAPNLEGSVLEWFSRTPVDTTRQLPNMRQADLLVGSFARGQVGYHRPFPGAGHYRTHLQGYYLCGSCCHPGGNITGLPGYNCAQVLLSDLGLPFQLGGNARLDDRD